MPKMSEKQLVALAERVLARNAAAARAVARDNIAGRVPPWIAAAATRHFRAMEADIEAALHPRVDAATLAARVMAAEAELDTLSGAA
jgi:hypothetical protein